jgi:hypothetical protein
MLALLVSVALVPAASAAPDAELQRAFSDAAADHAVPEPLLLALSWEASHWRPDAVSAWGGVGLFDLREADQGGVSVEDAAVASGRSPDALLVDPVAQIDGAAAILADHARRANGGALPPDDDLLAWWDAVRAFSASHDPTTQDRFTTYIYELVSFGVAPDDATGLALRPRPVDIWSREPAPPPPAACDYGGCAQFVAAHSSNYTNASRGPSDIDYVVIHTVQGSYSGCISWFQNSASNVTAHYVVRSSDGQVTQMVDEEDIAWHAGNWTYNERSVGIEHEGYVSEPSTWYTTAMYEGSAALTADIALRNGVSIDRSHIIGHVEVPGATHTDPGSGWDWDRYMDLVNGFAGGGGSLTGNLIGVVADSDIYNGARLVGATVWLEETGEVGATDGDGYYRFTELPLDSYTVHACADGFAEATCSKSISSGDNWCSIALQPGAGCSLTDGGEDTGPVDSGGGGGGAGGGTGGGSGTVDTFDANDPAAPPGARVAFTDTRGCATVDRAGAALAITLWAVGLAALRSRRDD